MSVTYGGVNLTYPASVLTPLAAWIEANISLREVTEFAYPTWPGRNRTAWPWPVANFSYPVEIGKLRWPVGASRWATFHWIATDAQLKLIRAQAYSPNSITNYQELSLVIDDGLGHPFFVYMYLMPARPLAQWVTGQQLYLLTLVDSRYFWWERAVNIAVTAGTTTWNQLITAIGNGLGITITPDVIPAAYLKPSASLTSQYEFLPLLLDGVAFNIGQRIVVAFDEVVTMRGAIQEAGQQQLNYGNFTRLAGGQFPYKPPVLNAPNTSNDLQALVPANVLVSFPQTDTSGFLLTTLYTVNTSLVSLALPQYPSQITGHAGTKVFHDECLAEFNGGSPVNLTELTTLAEQIATDYYLWKLNCIDASFKGMIPWPVEGMGDIIVDAMNGITRITPYDTFDNLSEEYNHLGAYSPVIPTPSTSSGNYFPIEDVTNPVGNSGTSPTVLDTQTFLLKANGWKMLFNYGIGVNPSNNTTNQVQVQISIGPQTVFNMGPILTGGLQNCLTLSGSLIRTSSTSMAINAQLELSAATAPAWTLNTVVTGLDMSQAQLMSLTAQATGAGAASNQIVLNSGNTSLVVPALTMPMLGFGAFPDQPELMKTAGVPFGLTVASVNTFGAVFPTYTGTAHFSTTDTGVTTTLPSDYIFTAPDKGIHILTGSMLTIGPLQTITAKDTVTSSLTGTSNPITVTGGTATHLVWTGSPSSAHQGAFWPATLTAEDVYNNVSPSYSGTVHFSTTDGSATLPSDFTFTPSENAGIAVFLTGFTMQTLGGQTVTAKDTTTPSITGSVNITVIP